MFDYFGVLVSVILGLALTHILRGLAKTPDGIDYKTFFFDNRQWFYGLAIIVFLMDIPEVLVKAKLGLRPIPSHYPLLTAHVCANIDRHDWTFLK